jgi:ferritin-like metal-binding protein YciE
MLKETEEGDVRDAALIAVAQRVGTTNWVHTSTVRVYAQLLGQTQCANLLQETLEEENAADQKLTSIADKVKTQATHQHA